MAEGAVPNPNLGLAMSRHEFSIAVRLWLGITLFPAHPSAVRCKCGQLIDGFGDHLLGCRQIHLPSKRHDALRDVIFNALLVDDKGTLKEQRFSSDTSDRPGDVFHPNFLTGRPAYFDITVRNSFQPKFVSSSATAAGAAGLAGEMEKDAKYDVLVSASDALFYPLAVESFGAWTPASLDCLRTIATKTITSNNIPFSQAYSNLMQQLSVNLWKFNARMIESRLLLDSDDCFWDLPVMSVSVLL